MSTRKNGSPVDSMGRIADDPTANVRAELRAGKERADDLRSADKDLRGVLRELVDEKVNGIRREAKLRTYHNKEMHVANNERLAALRQVDIATRNEDRKTADDAIKQLAGQTESLRQTLEKRVVDTADTLSKTALEKDRVTDSRITALEKSSYTGAGEKAVADPAMAQLVIEIKKLSEGAVERRGGQQNMNAIVVGISVLVGIGGLLVAVLK